MAQEHSIHNCIVIFDSTSEVRVNDDVVRNQI